MPKPLDVGVTGRAKEAADTKRSVVVVNVKTSALLWRSSADGTLTALRGDQGVVLGDADSVALPQNDIALALLGIADATRSLAGPAFTDTPAAGNGALVSDHLDKRLLFATMPTDHSAQSTLGS